MSLVIYEGAALDPGKKRRLVGALTRVLSEVLEVPPSSTQVFIREHPPENLGIGGHLLADYPDEARGRESRAESHGAPGPERILELHFAFAPPRVLGTAVELGVFQVLSTGPLTAPEAAERLGASTRGTQMLLDALGALGFLVKEDGRFRLTEEARRFLVPGQIGYLGDLVSSVDLLWEAWGHLTRAVRDGRPHRPVQEKERAVDLFTRLVPGLYHVHYRTALALADYLGVGRARPGLRVLDVAAGSGVWSIALALADPRLEVTALDFPQILDITRSFASRHGVADRFSYLPGNLREVDFGSGSYDMVILGHICHSEGERWSRTLFEKSFRALRTGGMLVIAEILPDDDRKGPLFALLFALNMLVATEEGTTFTLAQLRQWLGATGFRRVDAVDLGAASPLVLATKP